MIRILTGPIRSYKTTTLLHWALRHPEVGGVLTPDRNEIRHLYRVSDTTWLPWQKSAVTNDDDFTIGRFIFDGVAFATALDWLQADVTNPGIRHILMDEIGPLELSGKGFDPWLRRFLQYPPPKALILVVRDSVLEDVLSRYQLYEAHIVQKSFFE